MLNIMISENQMSLIRKLKKETGEGFTATDYEKLTMLESNTLIRKLIDKKRSTLTKFEYPKIEVPSSKDEVKDELIRAYRRLIQLLEKR